MNGFHAGMLRRLTAFALAGALLALLVLPAPGEEKRKDQKGSKLHVGPGFSQAVLATQLALQGEKRKSPILMLAAAELVADLTESSKPVKNAHLTSEGGAPSTKGSTIRLSVAQLVDRARAYAKNDKNLSKLIQKRGEQLTSRGLDPAVGTSLPSVNIKDVTYKIIGGGKVPSFGSATLNNVAFVQGKVAMVAAVGENNMQNLVIEVRDATGSLVTNPPNVTSKFLTVWLPFKAESYNVTVRNNGAEQKVALLANWD